MLSAYPACFIKEDAGYSVIFPDLNDLATCEAALEQNINFSHVLQDALKAQIRQS